MEVGTLQLLSSVLQYVLRSLCVRDSPWVYAIFWRIFPRNYLPPKRESGGTLDRSKENKRNCQCHGASCESSTKFGPSILDYSHRYIYREGTWANESHDLPSWSSSDDPQPKAWELQFKSGIKTIAVVSVREGLVQLGSLEVEDGNFVTSIQRKFSCLHSIPGIFTIERPLLTSSLLCNAIMSDGCKSNLQYKSSPLMIESKHGEFKINHGAPQFVLGKRFCIQTMQRPSPKKAINSGWNAPHASTLNGAMFPSLSSGLGALSPARRLPMNHGEYLQFPAGDDALEGFRTRINLEFVSSVKTEPIVEAHEEDLITTCMNT